MFVFIARRAAARFASALLAFREKKGSQLSDGKYIFKNVESEFSESKQKFFPSPELRLLLLYAFRLIGRILCNHLPDLALDLLDYPDAISADCLHSNSKRQQQQQVLLCFQLVAGNCLICVLGRRAYRPSLG